MIAVLGTALWMFGDCSTAFSQEPLPKATNDSTNYLPRWSPDGKWLAFARREGTDWSIRIIDAEGGGLRRITPPDISAGEPRWFPDGTRIAFRARVEGNRDIHVVDVKTLAIARLTTDPADDLSPACSPNGASLLFESNRSGASELWTMRADGSEQQQLTFGLASSDVLRPIWSPDG